MSFFDKKVCKSIMRMGVTKLSDEEHCDIKRFIRGTMVGNDYECYDWGDFCNFNKAFTPDWRKLYKIWQETAEKVWVVYEDNEEYFYEQVKSPSGICFTKKVENMEECKSKYTEFLLQKEFEKNNPQTEEKTEETEEKTEETEEKTEETEETEEKTEDAEQEAEETEITKCKAYTKKWDKCKNKGKYNGYCKRHINYEEEQRKHKEDTDKLLKKLANFCIERNFYRRDNQMGGWYHFNWTLLKDLSDGNKCAYSEGYMFLDEKDGDCGMIRLYLKGGGNPKWSFWKEDGELKVSYA